MEGKEKIYIKIGVTLGGFQLRSEMDTLELIKNIENINILKKFYRRKWQRVIENWDKLIALSGLVTQGRFILEVVIYKDCQKNNWPVCAILRV